MCMVENCGETTDLCVDHGAGMGDASQGFRVLCRRHNTQKSNGAARVRLAGVACAALPRNERTS